MADTLQLTLPSQRLSEQSPREGDPSSVRSHGAGDWKVTTPESANAYKRRQKYL